MDLYLEIRDSEEKDPLGVMHCERLEKGAKDSSLSFTKKRPLEMQVSSKEGP